MTKLIALGAAMIVSAAIAAPVFAQDADVTQPAATQHARSHTRNYRGAYNQDNGPVYAAPNVDNFGPRGIDRSFPGGQDPSFNPSGS